MTPRWRRCLAPSLVALLGSMPVAGADVQEAPAPRDETAAADRPSVEGPEPFRAAPQKPLPIDADTAIARIVARWLSTPRFTEEIEVRDRYQEALDAHLQTAALECRPVRAEAPPSHEELNRYGANPRSPSADLLTPARLLGKKLKGLFSGDDARFFVYSIRAEAAPGRVVYLVLDEKVPGSLRHAVPGTTWGLVAKYGGRDEAVEALARLETGDPASPDREPSRALWAATGCE